MSRFSFRRLAPGRRRPASLFGRGRGKTAMKIVATSRPGGMCRGGGGIAKRGADLRQPRAIEPALADAAADGPTIGAEFASADVVMSTLMIVDEQTDGSWLAGHKGRIDHQELGIRHGYAEIEQACIQHVADVATAQFARGNLQAAVGLQANRRRGA